MWSYTDLALEARGFHPELQGVRESRRGKDGVVVTLIEVLSDEAARILEKPKGRYVTIECPAIAQRDLMAFARAAEAVKTALEGLMEESKPKSLLVLGLGNRLVTPDSLGPRTITKLYVTRQIVKSAKELAPEHMREVAAIAPGVLGVTGLETVEAARGLIREMQPDCLIAIDALASRQADHLTTVIQLNDSGVLPGAGVNNRQKGLDQDSLGIPVIAVGVPTVVFASTIVFEALTALNEKSGGGGDPDALYALVDGTMRERFGNMIVTPKDVDVLVEDASKILADGINAAIHGEALGEIKELLS